MFRLEITFSLILVAFKSEVLTEQNTVSSASFSPKVDYIFYEIEGSLAH